MEQEEAEINTSCRRYAVLECIFVFTFLGSSSGYSVSYSGVCDRVCGLAMGPAGELSPRASPGFGNRVIDQLDQQEHTVLPDFELDAH